MRMQRIDSSFGSRRDRRPAPASVMTTPLRTIRQAKQRVRLVAVDVCRGVLFGAPRERDPNRICGFDYGDVTLAYSSSRYKNVHLPALTASANSSLLIPGACRCSICRRASRLVARCSCCWISDYPDGLEET